MTKKNIFILVGNPDNNSFSNAIAEAYAKGARASGHDVKITRISDMVFDPILHKGYKTVQPLEVDLKKFQEDVKWCNHFVTIYPIWWSDMPALMKGLIDRVWLPGFGFKFRKGIIPGWYRLLKGRTARIIVHSDQMHILLWALFGGNINNYTRGVLRFSGFRRIRRTWWSGITKISPQKAQCLLLKAESLGRGAK